MHKFEAYFPNQPTMKYVPLYVQFEFKYAFNQP